MQRIQGTFILDGLLEGRLFSEEDEPVIRRFINDAKKEGLNFYLKLDRNSFSILPNQQVATLKDQDQPVDVILKRLLEKMADHYTPQECAQFMSTLRSVEYISGFEKQVLYGIDTQGRIVIEKRMVPADTIAPQKELTLREKIRIAGVLVALFLILFLISAVFVPYKQICLSAIESIKPYNVKQLAISGQRYSDFFTFKEATYDSREQTLILVFQTTASFPRTEEQLNTQWLLSEKEMEQRLIIEAIARQAVRCILFSKDGTYSGQYTARMIWTEQPNEFTLTIPFSRSIGKIELGY